MGTPLKRGTYVSSAAAELNTAQPQLFIVSGKKGDVSSAAAELNTAQLAFEIGQKVCLVSSAAAELNTAQRKGWFKPV